MLEELQRRNFSSDTLRGYLGAVEQFARYFGKPPDRLGPDQIRQWQAYLLHERKLAVGTVVNRVAALRFFFRRVLKRRFPPDSIPYPNYSHHRAPRALSPEEVARLIDAAGNLQARTILMTFYSTGMRRAELVRLRVEDTLRIDFICALCSLSAFTHYGFILMSQKNPETESVRDQQ
jgi:integrase